MREEHFWQRVDRSGGADSCWPYIGPRFHFGHGAFWADGRQVRAHRYSWELANGPIPDGLCVCHRCDNPPCVNPAHLFLGSKSENTSDMHAKGRGRSGMKGRFRTMCAAGHPREAGTKCRECRRAAKLRYLARHGDRVRERERIAARERRARRKAEH